MSDVESTATGAVITALAKPSIPNGKARTGKAVKRKTDPAKFNKAVEVKREGAGKWQCDICGTKGTGGLEMLVHSRVNPTHRVYTPKDDFLARKR